MRKSIAFAGTLAAAGLLAASGTTAFAAMAPEPSAMEAPAASAAESGAAVGTQAVAVKGVFAYDQDKTLSNGQIRSVFASAVNALCAPTLEADRYEGSRSIDVLVEGLQTMQATIDGLAHQSDTGTFIMGCACASNPAGGGAAANAEVQGVAVGEVMRLAYAG